MMTATMAVFVALRMIPLLAVAIMAAMIGVRVPGFDHHDPRMAMPMHDAPGQTQERNCEQQQTHQPSVDLIIRFHKSPYS